MIEIPNVDDYLFGRGLKPEDYYISKTPFSEEIFYTGPGGRDYVLHISNSELADKAINRLKEIGVRIVGG